MVPESILQPYYKSGAIKWWDQGTGDKFFDEQQFEAYRELGLQLGVECFSELSKPGKPLDILNR